jgi:hypothetical protein
MVLSELDPKAMSEADNSTICTHTPPETVAEFIDNLDPLADPKPSPSSVPWPGYNFLIRDVETGHLITLEDGRIIMAQPGGPGSIHWQCVETKGWLGFRNTVSGRYLGHDPQGKLCCSAGRHQGWENFSVRLRPDGGYVLLMTHFERLWHIGIKHEKGFQTLAKLGDGGSDGIIWEFVKV